MNLLLSFTGWPVPAHSVAICEGLEDWAATDLSNLSDSDEDDQPAPLVRFKYLFNHYLMYESSLCMMFLLCDCPGGGPVQSPGGEQHGEH